MSNDCTPRAIWHRSLTLRTFGVTSAIELLFASAYVSQLLGRVMLLIACVLIAVSAGSGGHASASLGDPRHHRRF